MTVFKTAAVAAALSLGAISLVSSAVAAPALTTTPTLQQHGPVELAGHKPSHEKVLKKREHKKHKKHKKHHHHHHDDHKKKHHH